MINPIFIEYYSHEQCDCYKLLRPWPEYAQEKIVLCRVDEGIETAWEIARKVIADHLEVALTRAIQIL